MQPLPGTRDQEDDRMPTWCTIGHSLSAAALAAGLLLAISCPVRAGNGIDPRDQTRGGIIQFQLVQLAPPSSIPQRPVHVLPAGHVEAIQRFIGAINEGRSAEAVAMLSAELVPDAAARRDWSRQFSAIKSIHVLAIEPSVPAATAPCHQYKVKLEAHVAADPTAAMPFYGWDDNPNYRWIRLCPAATGAWTITSLGTGP